MPRPNDPVATVVGSARDAHNEARRREKKQAQIRSEVGQHFNRFPGQIRNKTNQELMRSMQRLLGQLMWDQTGRQNRGPQRTGSPGTFNGFDLDKIPSSDLDMLIKIMQEMRKRGDGGTTDPRNPTAQPGLGVNVPPELIKMMEQLGLAEPGGIPLDVVREAMGRGLLAPDGSISEGAGSFAIGPTGISASPGSLQTGVGGGRPFISGSGGSDTHGRPLPGQTIRQGDIAGRAPTVGAPTGIGRSPGRFITDNTGQRTFVPSTRDMSGPNTTVSADGHGIRQLNIPARFNTTSRASRQQGRDNRQARLNANGGVANVAANNFAVRHGLPAGALPNQGPDVMMLNQPQTDPSRPPRS